MASGTCFSIRASTGLASDVRSTCFQSLGARSVTECRIVDGGIWNQANMTLTDAGEPLLQFVDGAESIGFGWYPLGYQKADGSFNSGALGKWGYVWFIGQTNASTARSLVISGTSLNLQTKTNQEAAKDIYLNVRCVKNYTK
jgi:hypothetical protein